MPCPEIDNAFAWAKQSTFDKPFPVTAFFTKHTGVLTDPNVPMVGPGRDYCWYAVGAVSLNAAGNLFGNLQIYANGGSSNPTEAMEKKTDSTVGVEIFPDGTVNYQQKIKDHPVGGMPPVQVKTTCLGGVLLTGTNKDEVIAVGVRRDAAFSVAK